MPPNYCKIRLGTLRVDQGMGFDVFLKLGSKYLLYAKGSDGLELHRMKHLKLKNVTHLFIREEDQNAYKSYVEASLEKLKNSEMSVDTKSELLVGEGVAAAEAVYENPEQKSDYVHAQDVMSIQVAHLLKNPDALEQMLRVESADKSLYRHCVNVATISIGLSSFLGASEQICMTVGMGGLMHDIGDKRRGTDLQMIEADMNDQQKESYHDHTREGASLLSNKKYISRDVLDIILLHHERIDGKGFPAGTKKLDQIFQVVGLANMYDRMVTFEGKQPEEAYEILRKMNPAPYQGELILGLKDVLKANKMLSAA